MVVDHLDLSTPTGSPTRPPQTSISLARLLLVFLEIGSVDQFGWLTTQQPWPHLI